MKLLILALFLVINVPALAQNKPQTAPALSEVEKLKMENLNLKAALLQEQYKEMALQAQVASAKLEADRAALIQSVEESHPGYVWHQAENDKDVSELRPVTARK